MLQYAFAQRQQAKANGKNKADLVNNRIDQYAAGRCNGDEENPGRKAMHQAQASQPHTETIPAPFIP